MLRIIINLNLRLKIYKIYAVKYIIGWIKRNSMYELNQNLAENLGKFLLGFRDEVVKGLQEYLRLEE